MQVVARVQPLPVRREVDDDHRAGHPQRASRPEVTGELGRQMEDRHHHIGLPLTHQAQQTPTGQPGQRSTARARPGTGREEQVVDTGVHPGGLADDGPVEAAQTASQAAGQQGQYVDDLGLLARGASSAGKLGGHRVVARPHARAQHEQPPRLRWGRQGRPDGRAARSGLLGGGQRWRHGRFGRHWM